MRLLPSISVALCVALSCLARPASAAEEDTARFETKAKQAYVVDAGTGSVLLAKNEDMLVPPASLAKLMTMLVVFDALARGEIAHTTTYTVSENAWRTGGAPSGTSTMFAKLKSAIPVADLVRGATIQLANDACIILAEGMAGSEAAFAERMTRRAADLGLGTTRFVNATGLPADGNSVTMRALVTIATRLQSEYPDQYRHYGEPDFEWNGIRQRNRNPLVSAGIGVDGLAAGYAEGFGYAIVASMEQDGRRVFAALGGFADEKTRVEETRRLLALSFSAFTKKTVFAANEVVGEASVYGGAVGFVPLVSRSAVDVLVPSANRGDITAEIVYRGPLTVPVKAGQPVGVLRILVGGRVLKEAPLETAAAVEAGTLTGRALNALGELVAFWR